MSVDFVADPEKNDKRRISNKEKKIELMPYQRFLELKSIVNAALEDMQHGLDTVIDGGTVYLLSLPISCPDGKGVSKPRLRIPFRIGEYISGAVSFRG